MLLIGHLGSLSRAYFVLFENLAVVPMHTNRGKFLIKPGHPRFVVGLERYVYFLTDMFMI